MVDPDKLALLNAAATGGSQGLARAQEEQAAQATTGVPISAALAQAVGSQGLTPEAAQQLAGIERAPVAMMNERGSTTLHANNAFLYDLARIRNQWMDTQDNLVLPAISRKLALDGLDGGGSGGGGGGRGGGGGGGSGGGRKSRGSGSNDPGDYKLGDWLKQAREDAGLVGSGIRSKTGLPPFLHEVSKQNALENPGVEASIAMALPRNLRARAWAESQYGATPEDIDKGMPIGGFLKDALVELESAIANRISFQRFKKDTQKAAKAKEGDQSKAVAYALALARQNLVGAGKIGSIPGGGAPASAPIYNPARKVVTRIGGLM